MALKILWRTLVSGSDRPAVSAPRNRGSADSPIAQAAVERNLGSAWASIWTMASAAARSPQRYRPSAPLPATRLSGSSIADAKTCRDSGESRPQMDSTALARTRASDSLRRASTQHRFLLMRPISRATLERTIISGCPTSRARSGMVRESSEMAPTISRTLSRRSSRVTAAAPAWVGRVRRSSLMAREGSIAAWMQRAIWAASSKSSPTGLARRSRIRFSVTRRVSRYWWLGSDPGPLISFTAASRNAARSDSSRSRISRAAIVGLRENLAVSAWSAGNIELYQLLIGLNSQGLMGDLQDHHVTSGCRGDCGRRLRRPWAEEARQQPANKRRQTAQSGLAPDGSASPA